MNTSQAVPGPPDTTVRTLRASDPAELLAQVAVQMRSVPRDSVALIGHRGRRSAVVTARIDLDRAAGDDGPLAVLGLLTSLEQAGCDGAFGIVVLGDGYAPVCEDPECGVGDADGRRPGAPQTPCGAELPALVSAMRILAVALTRLPGFDLPELWVLAAGRATSVRSRPVPPDTGLPAPDAHEPGELDLLIAPSVALARIDTTLVAAQSVLAGERLAHPSRPAADAVRALLVTGVSDVPRTLPRPPIGATFREAVEAVGRLDGTVGDPDPWLCVSACERIRPLVLDLAAPRRRDDLLDILIRRGLGRGVRGTGDPLHDLRTSARRPHPSISPGGTWFEALVAIERISRPAAQGQPPGQADPPAGWLEGWANLAGLLAMLAWWNHRYATAGSLTDRVLERRPDHALARWASLMAGVPVPPGWTPRGPA